MDSDHVHRLVKSCADIFKWPRLVEIVEAARTPKQADDYVVWLGFENGTARKVRDAVRLRETDPILWGRLLDSSGPGLVKAHYLFERIGNAALDAILAIPYEISTDFNMCGELVSHKNRPLLTRGFAFEVDPGDRRTIGLSKDDAQWEVALGHPFTGQQILVIRNDAYKISVWVELKRVIPEAIPDLIKVVTIAERREESGGRSSVRIEVQEDLGPFETRRINMVGAHVVGKLYFTHSIARSGILAEIVIPYWIRETADGFFLFLNPHFDELLAVRNKPDSRDKRKVTASLNTFVVKQLPALVSLFSAVINRAPLGPEDEGMLFSEHLPALPLDSIAGESFLTTPPKRLSDLFTAAQ